MSHQDLRNQCILQYIVFSYPIQDTQHRSQAQSLAQTVGKPTGQAWLLRDAHTESANKMFPRHENGPHIFLSFFQFFYHFFIICPFPKKNGKIAKKIVKTSFLEKKQAEKINYFITFLSLFYHFLSFLK